MTTSNNAPQPAPEAKARKPRTGRTLKQQNVDSDASPDMTVAEVAAFRREGESTVRRKIKSGAYVSFKSGDKRLVTRESVLAERARCLAQGPRMSAPPPEDRPPGRPRKTKAASVSAG